MGTPREMPMMKVALVAALLAFVSAQNASNATVGANETGTFSEQTPTKGQQPGMNNDAEKAHSNPTNRSTMTLKSLSPAKKCPNNCNDHGLCVDGQCLCEPGYIEADCILPHGLLQPWFLQVWQVLLRPWLLRRGLRREGQVPQGLLRQGQLPVGQVLLRAWLRWH